MMFALNSSQCKLWKYKLQYLSCSKIFYIYVIRADIVEWLGLQLLAIYFA